MITGNNSRGVDFKNTAESSVYNSLSPLWLTLRVMAKWKRLTKIWSRSKDEARSFRGKLGGGISQHIVVILDYS